MDAHTETSTSTEPVTEPEISVDEVLDAIEGAGDESRDGDVTADALPRARTEIETLKAALQTRTIIGQATGILMNSKGLSSAAAFNHLVELSSHTNIKIRDIAVSMIAEANKAAGGSLTDRSL